MILLSSVGHRAPPQVWLPLCVLLVCLHELSPWVCALAVGLVVAVHRLSIFCKLGQVPLHGWAA